MQVTNKNQLTKGDRVTINDNEIAAMMGYRTLTGTVFLVNPHNNTFSLKCNQTGALELIELGDGQITKE